MRRLLIPPLRSVWACAGRSTGPPRCPRRTQPRTGPPSEAESGDDLQRRSLSRRCVGELLPRRSFRRLLPMESATAERVVLTVNTVQATGAVQVPPWGTVLVVLTVLTQCHCLRLAGHGSSDHQMPQALWCVLLWDHCHATVVEVAIGPWSYDRWAPLVLEACWGRANRLVHRENASRQEVVVLTEQASERGDRFFQRMP